MSNESNTDDGTDDIEEQSADMTTQVTSTHKVLGRLDADNGTGVLGQNDASSGTPIGVEGAVPNSNSGYGLSTPDDARVKGSFATTGSFWVNINGNLNISHGKDRDTGRAGNVVMGHSTNGTTNGSDSVTPFVYGATISGGGYNDGTTTYQNLVYDHFGTISGGRANTAGSPDGDVGTAEFATVGGGIFNDARREGATIAGGIANTANGIHATIAGGNNNDAAARAATVGGGKQNNANGRRSTIPGGLKNSVDSALSLAAGTRAKAESDSTFIWNDGTKYHDTDNDGTDDGLSSDRDVAGSGVTGSSTFHIGSTGGVRIVTGANSVTYISSGSTGWSTTSTRTAKTNFEPVDTESILAGIDAMDVSTWEYRDENGEGCGERHIGPVAEQFHDVVDVGEGDEHINSINADGMLFAAVQALSAKLDEKDERIDELESRLEAVEQHLDPQTEAGTDSSPESRPSSGA